MLNLSDLTLIRTWEQDDFRLQLFDTGRTNHYGKSVLAYEFAHQDIIIFEGEDFACSPLHAIDSDETVASLLTFLSLRPGDTDDDYFVSYTPDQMVFALAYGEELSIIAYEMENPE